MRASVVVLALCMLLTGTINTIATKYQVGPQTGTWAALCGQPSGLCQQQQQQQ